MTFDKNEIYLLSIYLYSNCDTVNCTSRGFVLETVSALE